MMKVPFFVIIGKSPMNTVCDLISPVVLLMNSAVTNSGAAYVMSLSLHSSMEALTSSKRGLEKDRLIEPEKSSIGESSVRISSSPERAPLALASLRACQASLPISQSKDSVCRARRFGTSSGSRILAKEVRGGAPGIPDLVPPCEWVEAERDLPERETAKMVLPKDLDNRGRAYPRRLPAPSRHPR